MTGEADSGDARTASERRLQEHLELVRVDRPPRGRELVARIVRAARWQRAVRAPLRVAGMIAGAVLDGIARLVGAGRRAR